MANSIFLPYIKLTEFLGQVLGPDYEIALYEVPEAGTDSAPNVIAIANNHISERGVGSAMSAALSAKLRDETRGEKDSVLQEADALDDGRTIRSSYFLIRQNGRLAGILRISFDDRRYQEISETILRLCHPDSFVMTNFLFTPDLPPEDSYPSVSGVSSSEILVQAKVTSALEKLHTSADRLTGDERLDIIASLEKEGAFRIKGAVKEAAVALHCSQASIYRYLSHLRRTA